jgi:hypothetical protein
MAAPAGTPPRRRISGVALALAATILGATLIVIAVALLGGGGDRGSARPAHPLVPHTPAEGKGFGPLAYDRDRNTTFERRAAEGFSHPLYTQPPGGPAATAARVERWRPQIDRAAADAGIDADTLAAMVYLESAGRTDAIAGPDPRSAAGLTQILPGTARDLLGMHVDLAASVRLTKLIAKAQRRARPALAAKLTARRTRLDDRFNPIKALAGTARYLRLARAHFPREDLAVEAYHMGIGNLEQVLAAYGHSDVPYAQVYFDTSPGRHRDAYAKLANFGDDSATYWFRVLAAKKILRLAREDPEALAWRAQLQQQKNSAEDLLHPPTATRVYPTPADVRAAEARGELVGLDSRKLLRAGVRVDPHMGELAPRLGQRPWRYRALRPEALATLAYIGAGVRALSGGRGTLTVTSTVRDTRYQRLLIGRTIEATHSYALHTTGYAFDIRRAYTVPGQAYAFQFFLNRLQALGLIAWVREPGAIHVTVANEAATLEPALDRLGLR